MSVDVSIVMVSYNTADLLEESLTALLKALHGLDHEIVVVDNASRDDSAECVSRKFSSVRLIENAVNVGFGRANNQVLEGLVGRYVLLLNTDAIVSPDAIVKTISYMDANLQCGILGVRLVGRDGKLQPSARFFPTPWRLFVSRIGLKRIFPKLQAIDDLDWDHASVRDCDWVPGCYYLVRREVIEQVGLFDPRFFLYYEEVDHCFAAKKAGWDVRFYPEVSVIHIGGESAKSAGDITQSGRQLQALQIESQMLYFRKNLGWCAVVADVVLALITEVIVIVKQILKPGASVEVRASWKNMLLIMSSFVRTRCGANPTR